MVDIVNLRRVRKRRARKEDAAAAAAARLAHGRTRGEREAEAMRREAGARRLDQARREPPPAPGTPDD